MNNLSKELAELGDLTEPQKKKLISLVKKYEAQATSAATQAATLAANENLIITMSLFIIISSLSLSMASNEYTRMQTVWIYDTRQQLETSAATHWRVKKHQKNKGN